VCSDDDGDTCDDCSDGSYGLDDDGADFDTDGACDAGDSDDDNDGAADDVDSDDFNAFVCSDDDGDTCDDCSDGSYGLDDDGADNDTDGICDDGDFDDDNDGALDADDEAPFDPFACSDHDGDTCDDCSTGNYGTDNDGPDGDFDGMCDAGDACLGGDDNYDGDGDGKPDDCDVDLDLHDGANLVSFYALPEATDVPSIFASLGDNISGVIGQAVVSAPVGDGDAWVGTLTNIESDGGYWVKVSGDNELETQSDSFDGSVVYSINAGNNLRSYSYAVSQYIEDAIPAGVQSAFYGIAGEGVAALHLGGGDWLGSLDAFEGGKGYWLVAHGGQESFEFSYNEPSRDELSRAVAKQGVLPTVPEEYAYTQSQNQSFYFVKSAAINGESLEEGDWMIAYNDNVVVGARMWNGEYTDIPAMGLEVDNSRTAGYLEAGNNVTFKVYDASEGVLVDMNLTEGESVWTNNTMTIVSMSDVALPTELSLSKAYPNPFNPSTSISYDVPSDMSISLAVYDVRGRMVAELANGMKEAGRYDVIWNAENHSSGIYFMQLVAGNTMKTQKMMLVK